jgi:hypothetical protein
VWELVPPPSASAVPPLLALRYSPSQFNIMGLFVACTALAPLALWMLARRAWAPVLAVSALVYAANARLHLRATGAAFEIPFPFLTWQLPFVFALVVGFHRRELAAALEGGRRRALIVVSVVLAAVMALFAWNNPWIAEPPGARLALISPDRYARWYEALVGRREWASVGRLLDAALIVFVLHAAFARWSAAAQRGLGWFVVPLGQASLYVFVVHLLVVEVQSHAPQAVRGSLVATTLADTAALLLLWLAVRRRWLFGLIPR